MDEVNREIIRILLEEIIIGIIIEVVILVIQSGGFSGPVSV